MKYAIIRPAPQDQTFGIVDVEEAPLAYIEAGLAPYQVDHGTVCKDQDGCGIAIVVAEFGLFEPRDRQHYFALGRHLYAGNAVLYAFDWGGETVDFTDSDQVVIHTMLRTFATALDVERAIILSEIERPCQSVAGAVTWGVAATEARVDVLTMKSFVHLERWRIRHGDYASQWGDQFGAFHIKRPPLLRVLATDGRDDLVDGIAWEHVSVSLIDRCPTWDEMCFIKELFWSDDECVVQYHPPKSDHVNFHPFCLHLWQPVGIELPRPPANFVGPK